MERVRTKARTLTGKLADAQVAPPERWFHRGHGTGSVESASSPPPAIEPSYASASDRGSWFNNREGSAEALTWPKVAQVWVGDIGLYEHPETVFSPTAGLGHGAAHQPPERVQAGHGSALGG